MRLILNKMVNNLERSRRFGFSGRENRFAIDF